MENRSPQNNEIEKEINIGGRVDLIKRILLLFIIITGLLFATIFIIQGTINFNDIKTEINSEIKAIISEQAGELNKYGSSSEIEGNIRFNAFPIPHVEINNIKGVNLTQNNFRVNFNIEKIKLYTSLVDILTKKMSVQKFEIVNGNFEIKELENLEYNVLNKIVEGFYKKLSVKNSNITITTNNSNIVINGRTYRRELNNINIFGDVGTNNISIQGDLLSNKQPLNINLSLNKKTDDYNGKLILSSQAFRMDIDLANANPNNLEISGKSSLNLLHPQLFSRTMFDVSSFLYNRVIDNTDLKINFNFSLKDNILNVQDIIFNGKNINAKANIKLDLNENSTHDINIDFDYLNLDDLIIRDLTGKNKNPQEKNISIFSESEIIINEEEKYMGFVEELIKFNPIAFDIKAKKIKFNNENISNGEMIFSYSESDSFSFDKIIADLPGSTKLSIIRDDIAENISLEGQDLNAFWNFLKNTSTKISQDKDKLAFKFNGELEAKNNKLFINNATFNSKDFKSKNQIEIDFDSGISYIAVKTDIEELVLDDVFLSRDNMNYSGNMLKNKILSLNEFTLNSFLRFNIKKILYKSSEFKNYNFTIKTSRGIFDVYNINLDDKIKGNISFDILQLNPNININIIATNTNIENNININNILFELPTMEDFFGNVNIVGKNLKFKKSKIQDLEINSKISKGILTFDRFTLEGFGGKCNINGFIDLKFNRKINMTFGGCTSDLKDTLYLFTNTNNISGLIGFSAVIYTEGSTINSFLQNYNVKLQIIGSGINIDKFGLSDLNSKLFDINANVELLKKLEPEKILYNIDANSVFEKLSGNIQYLGKSGGQIDVDISRPLINGKTTGSFIFSSGLTDLRLNSNFIMLSGTLNTTIPLTLPIAVNGKDPNISVATNFQQINSYIAKIKQHIDDVIKDEEIRKANETSEIKINNEENITLN